MVMVVKEICVLVVGKGVSEIVIIDVAGVVKMVERWSKGAGQQDGVRVALLIVVVDVMMRSMGGTT